jgi:putative transposase
VTRPEPHNKLSVEEREAVLALCNQSEYQSCTPAFIVADQLDRGCYLASESTRYRVLHEHDQVHPGGRQKAPERNVWQRTQGL